MEQWKDIKGYEGIYQVSNKGNVRALGHYKNCYGTGHTRATIFINKVRMLRHTDNGKGYCIVGLKKNGGRKNHYVHRLVAEAFLDKPPGCGVVDHIDFNIKNNNVNNLRWCTQKENIAHSKKNMHKPHKSKPSTGYKYIYFRNGRYRVNVRFKNKDRTFKTLEEAIKFRDEVLYEINYTI